MEVARSPSGRRLRVIMSAYHAAPGQGPEAAAGWAFAHAAARDHDVWLLTRGRFRSVLEPILKDDPGLAEHLHVRYVDLSPRVMRAKRRGVDLYWYYPLWQRELGRRALALHRSIGFDVGHHVTFANDWMPAGVAQLDGVPLVWGPVGGASSVPIAKLARWLGPRGTTTEIARAALTAMPRRIWGDAAARRAALVIAQNPDVARRFAFARRVVVEPNAALDEDALTKIAAAVSEARPVVNDPNRSFRAVFAGRLVAWKGARLALAALARPSAGQWKLDIYGEGYEEAALRKQVRALGLEQRVRFMGHQSRDRVLAAFAEADALLFPSMHDQAGWVAAEASSMGCPIVCLPLGGPPVLADVNAFIASLQGDPAENLATTLARAQTARTQSHRRWAAERLPALVASWYASAASAHSLQQNPTPEKH